MSDLFKNHIVGFLMRRLICYTIAAAYFHAIVEELVKMGYVRNKSVRGAPYDFRKAASKFKILLRENTKYGQLNT